MEERVEMTEKQTTLSIGAAMAAEIMIGFWFGIGVRSDGKVFGEIYH